MLCGVCVCVVYGGSGGENIDIFNMREKVQNRKWEARL